MRPAKSTWWDRLLRRQRETTKKTRPRVSREISAVTAAVEVSSPEVDSIGLPFVACSAIFLQLRLPDVASCMSVCKEWRSLIDTCAFWAVYAALHFDCTPTDPGRSRSVLCAWQRGNAVAQPRASNDAQFVFRPFPTLWRCGVVVPRDLRAPIGSVLVYHEFLSAVHWLVALRARLRHGDAASRAETCLFRWTRRRLPSSKEVLDMLGANDAVVNATKRCSELTKQELRSCYATINAQLSGWTLDVDLFRWMVERVGLKSIVFQCGADVLSPRIGFILTRLSTTWLGGILYAV